MRKIILFILLFLTTFAMGQTKSKWVEVEVTDIPTNTEVHTGTTRTGNTKYYIIISDGTNEKEVTLTESNVRNLQSGCGVVLVKKQNTETGKFQYTTRSKNGRKSANNDFNLKEIKFKLCSKECGLFCSFCQEIVQSEL